MRLFKLLVIGIAFALTGCASGIKHKDMVASIPTMQPDAGRVYFYRSASMLGAAVQPSIKLDGATVGDSKPGGFFYVDRAAGDHEVMCTTEVDKKLTFTLENGEVKYVKTSVLPGLLIGRVIPELVSAEEAQKELPDLSFTGADGVQESDGKVAVKKSIARAAAK
ncbi:MAG: hypothetical protein JWR21_3026 [Herminiimonas sp.]|nr:hypothetical protein [Herminiimonas sp.]MDB5855768.1 hypothetical protein [Herminiimonas sp.]